MDFGSCGLLINSDFDSPLRRDRQAMEIESNPVKGPEPRFIRLVAAFCALLGLVWLILYGLWWSFPSLRPGHEQIYDLKLELASQGDIFERKAPIRVVMFGDSRVLSGFDPDLFDELSGGEVQSYNLGLPNSSDFLDVLEGMVTSGSSPTHALLVSPWASRRETGAWDLIQNDQEIISKLFPFRYFPRDLAQFLVRSYQHGGVSSYYDYMQKQVDSARRDRGYFFIEHMSHFPNDRLPEDFRLESESPDRVLVRPYQLSGKAYMRVRELSDRHGIQFVVVPLYHREGQYAPPRPNEKQRQMLEPHGVWVMGPDYWLYPNALFSDPIHANREGAAHYTQQLWNTVGPLLLESAGSEASGKSP